VIRAPAAARCRRRAKFAIEVRELNMMTSAARAYAAKHQGTWANNSLRTIAATTLVSDGQLRPGFARRVTADGQSPWIENYVAIAHKDGTGAVRLVITEHLTMTPNEPRLRRAGYTLASVTALKGKIAAAYTAEHPSDLVGTIAPGTRVLSGTQGGFTETLTAHIPSGYPPYAKVALLVSWPEYDPCVIDPTGPGCGAGGGFSGDCKVTPADLNGSCRNEYGHIAPCMHHSAVTYIQPSCDTGWTEMDRFPFCPSTGTASFRATPVGSLSYATASSSLPGGGVTPGARPRGCCARTSKRSRTISRSGSTIRW
jgi:hypothetical protein